MPPPYEIKARIPTETLAEESTVTDIREYPAATDSGLPSEVLYGLPGEIVKTIDPFTEADPLAVLVTNLIYFGNVIGRKPHFMVEATPHFTNINAVFAGRTSKSRKGTSRSTTEAMYRGIDSVWVNDCFVTGMASGEGLIHRVRDPQPLINDPGVSDKRLMVIEEEFSRPLKVMARDTNILSDILRNAWDGKVLSNLTRKDAEKATDSHISIIGHVTDEELLRYLTQTDMANGFANRFLWFSVKRSKLIPTGKGVPSELLQPIREKLQASVQFAREVDEMQRDEATERLWADIYPKISEGKPGLVGGITSRAEAQILRLSMIYALMDRSATIREEHLKAALALWYRSEESVECIFAGYTGDGSVDALAKVLKAVGKITRTQIYRYFGGNVHKSEVNRIIAVLCANGIASTVSEEGEQVLFAANPKV
jgi:hypothetical protein